LYWNPGVTCCRKLIPLDFVSVLDEPVDDATASENSLLYPAVTVSVGPVNIHPAMTSTDQPWLFVYVVDFSLDTLEETLASKLIDMSQPMSDPQGKELPSTTCLPDLVYGVPLGFAWHCGHGCE
jgi:hypothetical protein